jgi:membrane fusion protein, copper/silver efflux system
MVKRKIIFVVACTMLCVLAGCEPPDPNGGKVKAPSSTGVATLLRQADGSEVMEVPSNEAAEGSIGSLRQVPLPDFIEATGQVTFDDRLVSTISSRVTGRVEYVRTSQWDMVRRGELVMSLYSPDFMSAEAEYLVSMRSAGANDGAGAQGAFGIPPGSFDLSETLRTAAIRKLQLLGFSRADIAAIRRPASSVWMRAPISGIVVSKNIVLGQQINPGDQLFSLATLQQVWITADIYEDQLARVRIGQNLDAITASYPGEVFKGTVERVSPTLDPTTHTLQLRCRVENPNSLLKPQMLARVRIAAPGGVALIIPQAALVFDDHVNYVFIADGPSKIQRRPVEVADWSEPGYVRVVKGVEPGERFFITNTLRLNALWLGARGMAS